MAETNNLRLWDDNPTEDDMLGFGPVVESVVAAVSSLDLDPVTVALQSSWGGGKSSALKLIEKRLRLTEDYVVVTCDPWEYDDLPKAEVRALLIGQVLQALAVKPSFVGDARKLLKRIAWVKVGATITNMVLARTVDAEKLVEAFTPNPEEPTSMAGFRHEFEQLMKDSVGIGKVIVLVDDLDRCSPDSVVAILEAIKVFLSVPKMAFVLAAEEALIRFAIERSTNSGARNTYSDRYLEKIVQLPVRLPTLSREDAETFIALLLAHRRGEPGMRTQALIEHVASRRESGTKPYIGGPYASNVQIPHAEDLGLAAQIAQGLSVDKWSSPRAIKRFLNAWGVRVSVAGARGADLDLGVTLKLYILEDRFPKSFATLVETQPEDRGSLLDKWEAWAKGGHDDDDGPRPEGVEEETRTWASTSPGLASVAGKIDSYLNVAATFTSASAGEGLSSETLRLMDDLLDGSPPIRRIAVDEVVALPVDEREAIVIRLLQRAGAVDAAIAIESAAEVAKSDPALAPVFHVAVRTHALRHIVPASVVDIAGVSGAEVTLKKLVEESGIESDVREMAREELTALGGQKV
ncbi:P-loop ATPase [Mycobacteroides abscessus subsp. abscessus]|uniref:KAP family P-loop NTPase fold protein n=1 Tax=Mycobacteroides abscessus TaxID=36809 RepID=UPI0009292A8F|nr:P-loop NTPase fold protein [Mycobacteroides abscessus]SIK94741.1 P-loop ATPase [Mycobacteroides abscessus subsp. abscessus]SLC90190.1 P-loop ATPase [Mycobacteroides abscessus subsp. abscessus]